MILKLKEVYRSRSLSRDSNPGPIWLTRDIFINTKHIVLIRENLEMKKRLTEGSIKGVKGKKDFCTISLDKGQSGSEITVVASLEQLESDVKSQRRSLLNG